MHFLPFLLILLMPAGKPPTVESVIRVDGLSIIRQIKLGPGVVQVCQVEGGHVGVGGVGAVVQPDDCLVFLHPSVLPCSSGGEMTALALRSLQGRT